MKKLIFFVVSAFLFASLISCSNGPVGPGATKTVTTDTTIMVRVPIVRDRIGCSGNILPGSIITGWDMYPQLIQQITKCGFTNDELAAIGYVYKGVHDPVTNPNFWERRSDLELFLLVVLTALSLGLLLRWLINRPANTPPPANPPVNPPAPVSNQANRITRDDMATIINAMSKNGGSLSTNADGSFQANFNPEPSKPEAEPGPEPTVKL